MYKKIIKITKLFYLGLFLLLSSLSYANEKTAANYINDLSERVIAIVKDNQESDQDKEGKLSETFLMNVDTKWIGRFAIGKFWRTLTAPQQENFLNLYAKYLTGLYVPNFKKYTSNIVNVTGVKNLGNNEYIVATHLVNASKTLDIKIDYRILAKPQGMENFIILDIIAEGVSLIVTQRAELTSVIENNGFDSLINLLRQKISAQY